MCKIIAHSIQSRLLYVPAKFQGTFVESLFLTLLCADNVLKRLFAMARTPIYKTAPGRNVMVAFIIKMSKDCRSEVATFWV